MGSGWVTVLTQTLMQLKDPLTTMDWWKSGDWMVMVQAHNDASEKKDVNPPTISTAVKHDCHHPLIHFVKNVNVALRPPPTCKADI